LLSIRPWLNKNNKAKRSMAFTPATHNGSSTPRHRVS
jgi:hypothetical protein